MIIVSNSALLFCAVCSDCATDVSLLYEVRNLLKIIFCFKTNFDLTLTKDPGQ